MFQQKVNRNFTTGFAGEIVRDGPTRARPARLTALTAAQLLALAGRESRNTIGRVYGTAMPPDFSTGTGTTNAAFNGHVVVGGAQYEGVLIHPKHYVLQGNDLGGSLAATYFLPDGSEVEIADMAIIVAEIFNPTAAAITLLPDTVIAYATNAIVPANDTYGIPVGALVATNPGAGFKTIPNAKVISTVQLLPSAAGAPMSTLVVLQLTT